MPFHPQKQRTTFGEVILAGFVFLVADAFIAFTPSKGLLLSLGLLEIIGIVALIARATWDSLASGIKKELKKL